jgi:tetratricopeptide (TPR) repeat protein
VSTPSTSADSALEAAPRSKAHVDRSRSWAARSVSLGRRLWFGVVVLVIFSVGFVLLGPISSGPSPEQRLAAMAPPFGTEAAADASATDREIAEQYAVVSRYPQTLAAYIRLGNAYVQRVRERADPTDYTRAEAAYDEASRLAPEDVNALIGKGVLALARHRFEEALAFGERARRVAPGTARVHGVIVDAQVELGRYDEAVASAQRMIDLRPDLASYSRVSYLRELHGDLPGAIAAMEQAFAASSATVPENREYLRVLIGDLRLRSGDIAGAEELYQASLTTLPDFVWARAGLARVMAARGDLDEAIAIYEGIVATTPLPEFVVALGEAQEAAGWPGDAAATYELAHGIQALFTANGVNVDLDLALFEADHATDPVAAVELARRAHDAQPNVRAADALGWAYYRAGNLPEARRYADEALRLGTPYGLFLYHAGMIAYAEGNLSAAHRDLSRAVGADLSVSPLAAQRAREVLGELGV